MNVLVLQSFLAVSFPSVTTFPGISSVTPLQVSQAFQVVKLYFFKAPSV